MEIKAILKTKKGRLILAAVAGAAVVVAALAFFFGSYVVVGGQAYSRKSTELDLRGVELSAAQFDSLSKKMPECRIRWDVPLVGGSRDSELETVRMESIDPYDKELLKYFPNLKSVNAMGCTEYGTLQELHAERPELDVTYCVTVDGRSVKSRVRELSFAGDTGLDPEELIAAAPNLFDIELIDVTGCGLSQRSLDDLIAAYPDAVIKFTYAVCGAEFSTDAEEIDLSRIQMESSAPVEAALKYFPRLKKVVMCDCGISNEDMDALNKKYDDIRFVWRVYFSTFNMRTDDTSFIAAKYLNWDYVWNSQTDVFKYCTDLIGLDLGHMKITDMSFLQYMPHMQYLIMADGPLSDLTDIGKYCPELKYLEVFKCPITDVSPLLNCKNLEDLNICYTWIDDVSPLMEMTWLDRLWFCGNFMDAAEKEALMAALPDTEINMTYGGESTGGTWRYHEHYYEMRDAFGMFYMPGGTNGVDENGVAIVNG